jgi:hypothetical protein
MAMKCCCSTGGVVNYSDKRTKAPGKVECHFSTADVVPVADSFTKGRHPNEKVCIVRSGETSDRLFTRRNDGLWSTEPVTFTQAPGCSYTTTITIAPDETSFGSPAWRVRETREYVWSEKECTGDMCPELKKKCLDLRERRSEMVWDTRRDDLPKAACTMFMFSYSDDTSPATPAK